VLALPFLLASAGFIGLHLLATLAVPPPAADDNPFAKYAPTARSPAPATSDFSSAFANLPDAGPPPGGNTSEPDFAAIFAGPPPQAPAHAGNLFADLIPQGNSDGKASFNQAVLTAAMLVAIGLILFISSLAVGWIMAGFAREE
jgi:hypothetical protein